LKALKLGVLHNVLLQATYVEVYIAVYYTDRPNLNLV